MNIRKATQDDLESIVWLSEEMLDFHCSLDPYYGIYRAYEDSTEFYKEELQEEHKLYLVAENEGGDIVGFASASITSMPDTDAPSIGILVTNFVSEPYRGKGVGTAFHEKRMTWFREHNVKHVEMSVDVRNTKALEMWKKSGFEEYQIKLKKDLD